MSLPSEERTSQFDQSPGAFQVHICFGHQQTEDDTVDAAVGGQRIRPRYASAGTGKAKAIINRVILEGIVGCKLNGTRSTARTRYLAKIRVVDVVIGVGVTGKVKYIEAVHAEAYSLAFGDMEVFE